MVEKDWVEYISQSISEADVGDRIVDAVSQVYKSRAKGKGKADAGSTGSGEVNANSLASDQSLTLILNKIGQAFLAQGKGS